MRLQLPGAGVDDGHVPGGLRAHVVAERGRLQLDVELSVAPGEVLCVVGPNGSGKSTLLWVLAGLVPLAAGRVTLGGAVLDDVQARVHVPAPDRRTGLVPQSHVLFGHLSALENVAFGLRARGVPVRDARKRAADALEHVGLADHAHERADRLSGGQSQRVALARAVVVEPALLLLDEPFAALDEAARPLLHDVVRDVAAGGTPVVLVTHDAAEAVALGDRSVRLADGRAVERGESVREARDGRAEDGWRPR
ncbi:ABC transporter ATP-binding protein [Sanguibacter sp. HDW7]|uniref:ABC transporter ATP-binding protein n=1 Tax=Sanguibacter sp. HDW7 TaxID=2714931 RepID=UPI001408DF09|nr:ATP-binding cassette domain-containing protein [Sanguibacter sp. HDW7]QIK84697.1 ATP-binding cassette domain-containing protein [Sanguibacter sp. HDW7]